MHMLSLLEPQTIQDWIAVAVAAAAALVVIVDKLRRAWKGKKPLP